MANIIKEVEYRAKTIDEILEKIEVDKKKLSATERIVDKRIKRKLPLFWQKDYVYSVRYDVKEKSEPKSYEEDMSEKDAILRLLDEQEFEVNIDNSNRDLEKQSFQLPTQKNDVKEHMFEGYRHRLLEAEIREDIVNKIIDNTKKELVEIDYENDARIEQELLNQMVELVGETLSVTLTDVKKIVLFGPTGVGKTTTIGKMAGILVSQGKRIGLITTDVYRIGATYQLDTYAKILNSTMKIANSPKELAEAIHYFENVEKVDHILVDTVGRSPMDAGNVDEMQEYLEVANPDHTCLVLSCTQKEKDIYKILENFEKANITSLIFTKLDETLQHGIIMNIMADKKAKVSFIANGQDVPQDLYIADAYKMANKMLRGVDEFERPSF